jgi:hypothetical protein
MQLVDGFGSGQVVAYRADTAKALHKHRHLPVRMPLNEPLKAPELDNMEAGFADFTLFVQMNGHPAVPFYPGDRVNGNLGGLLVGHD